MNQYELEIKEKYEKEGFDVIHVGVPDFILLKQDQIKFCEVKSTTDLTKEQTLAVDTLRSNGFQVIMKRKINNGINYGFTIDEKLWERYKNKVPRSYDKLNDHLIELIKKFIEEE